MFSLESLVSTPPFAEGAGFFSIFLEAYALEAFEALETLDTFEVFEATDLPESGLFLPGIFRVKLSDGGAAVFFLVEATSTSILAFLFFGEF